LQADLISLFGTLNRPSGLERPVNTTIKHDNAQAAGEHDMVEAVSNHMTTDDHSDVNMSEDSDSTISAHDDIIGKLWDGESKDLLERDTSWILTMISQIRCRHFP